MLQVHLSDGRTLRFDLSDSSQAAEWTRIARDAHYQSAIRGITLQNNGVQYSATRPSGFNRIWFFAEYLEPVPERKFKGGERIVEQVDSIRLTIMSHAEQKAVRVNLTNPGRQCYNPIMDK